jgi:hypothetical protein
MFRKPGTLEDMPRGSYGFDTENRHRLWTRIIEVMYEQKLDMPTVIQKRMAFSLAQMVEHRMKKRGEPLNPMYMTLTSNRLEHQERNLDGTPKYSRDETDIPDARVIDRYHDYWDVGIARAVGDLAVAYPRLDPFNPSTIPTFLHPNLGGAPKPLTGFVAPPSFKGQNLPWHEKLLVPLVWLVAWVGSLPAWGKGAVALIALALVTIVVF